MATLSESKRSYQQDSYDVVGAVEVVDDEYYLIDLFPGGPGPLLKVHQQSVTIQDTEVVADYPGETTQKIYQIAISKNVPITIMHTEELTEHPLARLAPWLPELNNEEASTTEEGNNLEWSIDDLLTGIECAVWKTNPLYWQLVAALKVAKSKGVISNESMCRQIASGVQNLSLLIGMPPGLTKLVGHSMSKCACKKVF